MFLVFKKVRWANFLSYGNQFTEVQLDRSKSTLIVGSNGTGKSTVLDALMFGLYGKPYRKINKPQLVNTINRKGLLVEVEFIIGKKEYLIRRGMLPDLFEIYCNGNLVKQSASTRDYQKYLSKNVLRITDKSFKQIVVLGSANYIPFMQLEAQHRREIIEDLLDIQIFSVMNLLLAEKRSSNKAELTEAETQLRILNSKIELTQKHLNELRVNNDELIKERQTRVKDFESLVLDLIKDNEKFSSNISTLSEQISDDSKVRVRLQKIVELEKKLEDRVRKFKKEVKFFNDSESCPTCQQEIDTTFKTNVVDDRQQKLLQVESALKQLEDEYSKVSIRLQEIDKINKEIQALNLNVSTNNHSISHYQRNVTELQAEVESLHTQAEKIEKDTSELDFLLIELRKENKVKENLVKEQSVIEIAGMMLKDTGIKTKIIRQYVPIMNKLINKYLQQMDLFIDFTLDENFNEKIKSQHRDEFSYECLPAKAQIETEDGIKTISWISRNKYRGKVLSLDQGGNFVWNNVVDCWSNKNRNKKWVLLKIDGNCRGTKPHLTCTHDHKVLVTEDPLFCDDLKYIEAQATIGKWTVRCPSYRDNPVYNNEQIYSLLGTMMGDGHVSDGGQVQHGHKKDHRGYVEFKQKIFGGGEIIDRESICSFNGVKCCLSSFTSPVNGQTKHLHDLLYSTGRKSPLNIINYLNEISLAFWYMDDGTITFPNGRDSPHRPYIELCTDSFNYEEHQRMQEMFLNKWNLTAKIIESGNYLRLRFDCDNSEKFLSIIAPYVIPECMRYKLPQYLQNVKKHEFDVTVKDFGLSKVHSIKYLEYHKENPNSYSNSSRLYDMEVENNHNFVANKTVVHNSFSEGEKARINFAILMTWRAIAKLRNSTGTNLLILDEIFDGSTDTEGVDAIVSALQALEGTNLFVISHNEKMADKFYSKIVFSKVQNFSRIVPEA